MDNTNVQLDRQVIECASERINPPTADWWVRDLSHSYPWLKVDRLLWIIDSKTDASALVLRQGGSCACLNGDRGVEAISRLLSSATVGIKPGQLSAEQLATTIMEWSSDPRGYVLSPDFWAKKQGQLQNWMRGRITDPENLRQMCIAPWLDRRSDGSWTLKFNAINRFGGVEHWIVKGSSEPFAVTSIDHGVIQENGSYYFPDEL
ncbi:MAG: hypothetical protein MUC79_04480 [Thiobacillaceae bacterium]|nr:hypothetical protein [Thiobacillaceae bacterium]